MAESRDELRRALRERVVRRLAGRAVPARAVERAIDAVVQALPPDVVDQPTGSAGAGDGADSEVVLAMTGVSVPDLGSRVRQALSRAGVEVHDAATATAGRHTVVTVRLPTGSAAVARKVAEDGGWGVSLVGPSSGS